METQPTEREKLKKKSLIANGSLNQKHKPKKITEIHTNNWTENG